MSSFPINSFAKAWIFKRQDLKISDQDMQQLLPLSEDRAAAIWRDYVSEHCVHPDLLGELDWPKSETSLVEVVNWESRWDSEQTELPESALTHLENWSDETRVYFCYNNEQVIETEWSVFRRCWKNFLFLDNGPLLLGKKKKQAIQFFSTGNCHLLLRKK